MTMIRILAAIGVGVFQLTPAIARELKPLPDGARIEITMQRDGQVCQASQYGVGDGYHGGRTASGERFNTYASNPYTAAMRAPVPFGSFKTVTNLANGRNITVRINDRGPFVRGRCIDLGRAGADALGMGGTARVRVE